MSTDLRQLWTQSGVDDATRALSERISGLQAWLTESIASENYPEPALLQDVDEFWSACIKSLAPAYTLAPQPYRESALVAWEQSLRLIELRLGLLHKQFTSSPTPNRFAIFRRPIEPPIYSPHAALALCYNIYLCFASAYHLPIGGFWKLCHLLFLKSIGASETGPITRLPTPLLRGAEYYRQMLVCSLANPYGMRAGFLGTASQLMDFFSPLVRLLEYSPAQDGARGLCVVSLSHDFGPSSVSRSEPVLTTNRNLFLQLHDFTYELQRCSDGLARGASLPVALGGEVEITRRETVEVLNAALASFAGISARAIPRVPAKGQIEVVSGFFNCWSVLQDTSAPNNPIEMALGSVINQTITGVAFSLPNNVHIDVLVGQVILFRRSGQPMWRVGVVRWIEFPLEGAVMLVGCQALGLRSDAYTATDQQGLDLPVIVAQVPSNVGDTTVLIPDHGVGADAQLTTNDGSTSMSFILTDLRETHVDCARYQFITL